MSDSKHLWALVLAAGEGRRLRRLTTTGNGTAVPKQFCALAGGRSLLQDAIARAARLAPPERICAIVAAQHRRWWSGQLQALPPANIVVQPQNRGTAHGILLPLLVILERDPRARIVLLPSDHHVRDEARLALSLGMAASPPADRARIVLLGLAPRTADPQLGYIVPGAACGRAHQGVERFVEKPDPDAAAALVAGGALWNAFIIAADAAALLELFERHCPGIVAAMRRIVRGGAGRVEFVEALAVLYEQLPTLDFSQSILQRQERSLRVLSVPECGWSDLGTPDRVAEALDALGADEEAPGPPPLGEPALLSLAARHREIYRSGAAAP